MRTTRGRRTRDDPPSTPHRGSVSWPACPEWTVCHSRAAWPAGSNGWSTWRGHGRNGPPGAKGATMAERVKNCARITGADRARLAGELTKKYANGDTIRDQ